jgi:hypothetical protein
MGMLQEAAEKSMVRGFEGALRHTATASFILVIPRELQPATCQSVRHSRQFS